MNDRQRIRTAQLAATRLAWVANQLDRVQHGSTLMGRIRDHQGGLRAKTFDGAGTSHRHDATFSQAMGADQAVADERELTKAIETASRLATSAMEIAGRYPPPHRATDHDLATLGHLNAATGNWCASCARTTSPAGGPRCEPPRGAQANPTDVGGRLAEPMLLCEWCYGCVRRWGRTPTVDELDRHHRGLIVPWPADVKRP